MSEIRPARSPFSFDPVNLCAVAAIRSFACRRALWTFLAAPSFRQACYGAFLASPYASDRLEAHLSLSEIPEARLFRGLCVLASDDPPLRETLRDILSAGYSFLRFSTGEEEPDRMAMLRLLSEKLGSPAADPLTNASHLSLVFLAAESLGISFGDAEIPRFWLAHVHAWEHALSGERDCQAPLEMQYLLLARCGLRPEKLLHFGGSEEDRAAVKSLCPATPEEEQLMLLVLTLGRCLKHTEEEAFEWLPEHLLGRSA